jgi:drug/metabolite transporter (DMT)-like permease
LTISNHSPSLKKAWLISFRLNAGQYWPLWLSLLAAVTYFVEYSLNFIFVGYVNTLTFSVCDITRRIAIIVVGAFLFDKKLTASNMIGIVLALGGVLGYSFLDARRKAKFSDSGKL